MAYKNVSKGIRLIYIAIILYIISEVISESSYVIALGD